MDATAVSVLKLKDATFKIEEVLLYPGRSVDIDSESSSEIIFSIYDDSKAVFIDGVYFDHKNRSLKSNKPGSPIMQKFRLEIREIKLMVIKN